VDRGQGALSFFCSVIVPVLNDADAVERLLGQIDPDPSVEVIIVDGGLDARLEQLAGTRPHTRVLRTLPGRARQMNAGARDVSGLDSLPAR
jgi:glycosyltransferase involved in cell wall biosynthesis